MTLVLEFERRVAAWQDACGDWSTVDRWLEHPTFAAIVALGPGVLPLIEQAIVKGAPPWLRCVRDALGWPEHSSRWGHA